MGANRKLQLEIDRTLKKVTEGIEVFDQIWEKVRRGKDFDPSMPDRSMELMLQRKRRPVGYIPVARAVPCTLPGSRMPQYCITHQHFKGGTAPRVTTSFVLSPTLGQGSPLRRMLAGL